MKNNIKNTTNFNHIPKLESLYSEAFPEEDLFPLVKSLLKLKSSFLSLTAEEDNNLIGHIIFTFCNVEKSNSKVALLGPLCVVPNKQKQGIGSELVRDGFQRLKDNKIQNVYVLGDPNYYKRFGFKKEDRVIPPYKLPNEWDGAWQSVSLNSDPVKLEGKIILPSPWLEEKLWLP